eukprot:6242487-Prymnesium_polylepis.2
MPPGARSFPPLVRAKAEAEGVRAKAEAEGAASAVRFHLARCFLVAALPLRLSLVDNSGSVSLLGPPASDEQSA